MSTTERQPFDFGVALHRRGRDFAEAADLADAHPDDPRFDRLRALVAEARERLRTIPRPLVEHPGRLAMHAEAQRAAVAEWRTLRGQAAAGDDVPADDPPPAAAVDEPPPANAPELPAEAPSLPAIADRPVGKDAAVEPAEAP
jgi:hypothetical protein